MFTFQKERSFQEIFSDSVVFLQQQWRTFFLYIIIYAAPVFAVAHYFSTRTTDITYLFSNELLTSYFFAAIANFLLQSIAYSYIICFIQNGTPTRHSVMEFFSKNIINCIKAFFISNIGIGIGFFMFIIPGFIVLTPLSLFMFDKIYSGSSSTESLSRSTQLTRSNIGLSYAVVLLCYIALFAFQFFVAALCSKFSVGMQILVNVTVSIALSSIHIPITLLYFSLRSKIQKNYDTYQ
jgi:hypothetical protein